MPWLEKLQGRVDSCSGAIHTSAEEQRQLMMFNQEERMKRESKVIADFKEMVDERIRRAQLRPAPEAE